MLDKKKKGFIFVTFVVSAVAVILQAVSLGTNWWIESYPERRVPDDIKEIAKNLTDVNTKFSGHVHFGLFRGIKVLDSGFGTSGRQMNIQVTCQAGRNLCGASSGDTAEARQAEIQETLDHFDNPASLTTPSPGSNNTVFQLQGHGLFNLGLLVCTILFGILSMVWGLVNMGFAIFNISTRPIETITGPMGLYLWNSLAAFFCLLAVLMYLILYFVDLRKNILLLRDRSNYWTSEGRTWLHFSFYLMLVATLLHVTNLLLMKLSGIKLKPVRFKSNINEKALDGVMMY